MRSNHDPNMKPRPHDDGIVCSMITKEMDQVTNQMKHLSLNQSIIGHNMTFSTSTELAYVYFVQ